jgi:hypothetical protein
MARIKEYVAYGELGSYKPGDTVNPADWSLEQWQYMVDHQVVVPKNSQNDPAVLEEAAAEQRDAIAEQSAQNDQPRQLSEAEKAHKAATEGKSADEDADAKSDAKSDDKEEPAPSDNKGAKDGTEGTNAPSPTPPAAKPPAPTTVKAATPTEQKKA